MFLKISQKSQENTCTRVSFLIKLQACKSCEWVRGVDIKDLINKFELSKFWKEIKLQLITNKYFSIVCCCNLLFVNCIVFGYSLLNISSTIRDLKLEGMPKYKKVWVWHTDIFALWFWVPQNYMKICFRNISSAKLKWKECTRRHDCFFSVLGLTQVGYFILNFPWPIFIVVFCHLLPSA